MVDSIEDVRHKKFKYIYIPKDMQDNIKELEFEGLERDFKNILNLHFNNEKLLANEKEKFSKDLLESSKAGITDANMLEHAIEISQTCQIIPLTLPTKTNNYDAVNAYIDNVGRVKNLSKNARASRITNDDIRGDCFISRTFDDEDEFKRIDFTFKDYENYLTSPPNSANRWNQADALRKLQQQMVGNPTSTTNPAVKEIETPQSKNGERCCLGCRKTENLKACGRCLKTYYCSRECQKNDWKFHKRNCKQ